MNVNLTTTQKPDQHNRTPVATQPGNSATNASTNRTHIESRFSIQEFIRREVFTELASRLWGENSANRQQHIERRLSDALNISSSRVLLSSGTAPLLEQLFYQFAPFSSDVVLANSSASFYEKLAKKTGVKPTYWALTDDFQYHEALFPTIQPDSLVLLASPNPLTGSGITESSLIYLLNAHPDTLFIVDETYATAPVDDLIRLALKQPNLVLVRSFTAAGTTLGYAVAEPYLIQTIRDNSPAISLNHISEAMLDGLLTVGLRQDCLHNQLALVTQRRNRFYDQLSDFLTPTFRVHNTDASFVLVQAFDQATYRMFAQMIEQVGIAATDLHQTQQLTYTFQLPVSKAEENEWVVNRLAEAMAPFGMLLFL